jgi:hypothetical protein
LAGLKSYGDALLGGMLFGDIMPRPLQLFELNCLAVAVDYVC